MKRDTLSVKVTFFLLVVYLKLAVNWPRNCMGFILGLKNSKIGNESPEKKNLEIDGLCKRF
jgi:hypothetical protein